MSNLAQKLIKFNKFYMALTIIVFIASLPLILLYAMSIDEVLVLLSYIPLLILFIIVVKFLKTRRRYYWDYIKYKNKAEEFLVKSGYSTPVVEEKVFEANKAVDYSDVLQPSIAKEEKVEEPKPVEATPAVAPVAETKIESKKADKEFTIKIANTEEEEEKAEEGVKYYGLAAAKERALIVKKRSITTYYLRRSKFTEYADIYDVINDDLISRGRKKKILQKLLRAKKINRFEFKAAKGLI